MTQTVQMVLRAFLKQPTSEMYGLQVCEVAGLPSGTIHPILARLEGIEWLDSRWEEVDPGRAGRPRRRYYRLSDKGAARASAALSAVDARSMGHGRWRPSPTASEGPT